MQDNTVALQAVSALADNLGDTFIEGVTEGNVSDHPALEVGPRPHTLGAVDDLVGDDKVTGLNFLLETADGGEGDDAADTDGAQSSNIGTSGDLVRGDLVVRAVTAQEGDSNGLVIVPALVVQDGDGGGGFTPGSRDRQGGNLSKARQLTEPSAADDGDGDRAYAICDCQHDSGGEVAGRGKGLGIYTPS